MAATHSINRSYSPREPFSYRSDPSVPKFADDKPVIIFDGFCALCSGWAVFVLKHDNNYHFRLLTAQSELGQSLYIHYGLDPNDYGTNMLIEQGVAWFKSAGNIRMAIGLGWPWRAAVVLRILPIKFIDWLYDKLARNRLRLFGKRNTCFLPAPEYADRFLS